MAHGTPTFGVPCNTFHGFGSAQQSPLEGGSVALASIATFHAPPGNFFHTVIYRPVTVIGSPFLSFECPS